MTNVVDINRKLSQFEGELRHFMRYKMEDILYMALDDVEKQEMYTVEFYSQNPEWANGNRNSRLYSLLDRCNKKVELCKQDKGYKKWKAHKDNINYQKSILSDFTHYRDSIKSLLDELDKFIPTITELQLIKYYQ